MLGKIVTMRRRSLLFGVAATVVGVAAGCTTGQAEPARTPILSSTAASTLVAKGVTPYEPVAGVAPGQTFAVGRRAFSYDRDGRSLPVEVWYPAQGAVGIDPVSGAAPAAGLFPVVLFSHGLTAQPNDYAAMLTRWAQAGFVVAAPIYPYTSFGAVDYSSYDLVNQPADASYVLTRLLSQDDVLTAHLDPERLAAAGHSGGGITTVGLFSAERDTRLTAGIVLAGTDFRSAEFTGPAAAMLFVHGRLDDTVAYRAGHTVFEAVPWSRAMLTVTGGGHLTTGDDFEATVGTSTEFLRWSLYGDLAAKGRIPAASAVDDVATLEDQL